MKQRAAAVLAVVCAAAVVSAAALGADEAATPPGRATILFFQDAHQLAPVVDRHGERGGFARLATLVARVRAEETATVVAFGGDLAGGTLFGGQFRGLPQVEAFNRIGIDVAAFGQHDFDFGSEHTRRLVAAARFPWVTTNLIETKGGRPFAALPRVLVREAGGLRIAWLGLTDDFDTTLREGEVGALDLVSAARQALAGLADPAPDAVIALAQTDTPGAERLLREIPRLAAVLAEEQAEDRSVITWIGDRPIASSAGNLGSVIRLDLRRGAAGLEIAARALPVDVSLAGEPGLERLTADYERRLEQTLGEPLAALATALPVEGARAGESRLGSLVADAWRAACAAEIALVNAGSLRADLAAGVVRRRDVVSVLPFGNRLVVLEVAGSDLEAALEHGASGIAARRGTLLHVSGLRYRIDRIEGIHAGAPGGRRVTDVLVAGVPLDPSRLYRVATSNYLARGGDGFSMLAAARAAVPGCAGSEGDAEALADHLRQAGAAGPISAPPAGRLTVRSEPSPP